MDVMRLGRAERVLFGSILGLCKALGIWRYPVRRSGDVETMSLLDKAYWMHKASQPICRARCGAGLEEHFRNAAQTPWDPPVLLESEAELTLSAVGDLISHPFLANSADSLYTEVQELIFGADVAMANMECVIQPDSARPLEFSSKSGPSLCLDGRSFDVIKGFRGRNFDFMSLASNHSLDLGADGVRSTQKALQQSAIAFHGTNETAQQARDALILECGAVRLGLLAFTFGLNGHAPPQAHPNLVNRTNLNDGERADLTLLEAQLAHCRASQADFVVAQLHWGLEHEMYPTPEQVALAHHLAELGIDAVVGHHPHVVQPMEAYRTQRDPNRVVPIFYSLGNLTTPFSAPFLTESAVARFHLVKGRTQDGSPRTYVGSASQHRVVQQADPKHRRLHLRARPGRGATPTRTYVSQDT